VTHILYLGGCVLKSYKLIGSSAVFIALTAVRLLSPAAAEAVSDAIGDALLIEERSSEAIYAFGSSIAELGVIDAVRLLGSDEAFECIGKPPKVECESAMPAIEYDGQSEKLSAFIDAQAAFTENSIPSDVLLTADELPFKYSSPVTAVTSSGFGFRLHPIYNDVRFHYGTDFAVNSGTEVLAFADGTVRATGEGEGYGKYIILSHSDGYETLYAHLSVVLISSGEVRQGEVIALSGNSGRVTGPHLHFELMCSGAYLNPEFYV